MTDGFRTDPAELAQRATAFAGLAERAGRIVADLAGELGSHGDCWGTDAAGQSFAGCHREPATAALRVIEELPAGLAGVGTRLAAAASTYAEADVAGHQVVRDAGRGLG